MKYKYDQNSLDRLTVLMELLAYYEKINKELFFCVNKINNNIIGGASYYSSQMDHILRLMASLIDEEGHYGIDDESKNYDINNDHRHLIIDKFVNQIKTTSGNKLSLTDAENELSNFLIYKTDYYINCLINDFIVHSYSTFEEWMIKIHKVIFNQDDKQYLIDKYTKIIKKYIKGKNITNLNVEELATVINDDGDYISGRNKIDKLLSQCKIQQEIRDQISLIGSARNTIHSSYIAEKTHPLSDNSVLKLNKNKPIKHEDFRETIKLTKVLTRAYTKCVNFYKKTHFDQYEALIIPVFYTENLNPNNPPSG